MIKHGITQMQFVNLPFLFIAGAISVFAVIALSAVVYGRRSNQNFLAVLFVFACLNLLLATVFGANSVSVCQAPFIVFGNETLLQRLDPLASVFLICLATVGICSAIFSPKYLEHFGEKIHRGQYWSMLSLFMVGMTMVLLSANAITFILFWEIMSFSSLALVASEHRLERVRTSAFIYLTATKTASAFLLAGFMIYYSQSHSWNFELWNSSSNQLGACFLAIGFMIKAGVWPCHLWLPYAHTAAPSPVSALMSGVMLKIALYGVIRLLFGGSLDSLLIAYLLLILGLISSFWGLLFGLVQQDLKRLLAYSSIENIGLIVCGLGAALIARHHHLDGIAVLFLSASLFQCVSHAITKSLLFLAVGSIDVYSGTRDLALLGGLQKAMPWTSSCFLLAIVSICALPPLSGFASKWLLYQAFFQQSINSPEIVVRATGLVSMGILALVGGMSLMCFVRVAGIALLGNSRRRNSHAKVHEAGRAIILSQLILSFLVLGVGLTAPLIFPFFQSICAGLLHLQTAQIQLTPLPLAQWTFVTLSAFAIVYLAFMRPSRILNGPTWDCGFGSLAARSQASAISFSQPIARIFAPLLRYKVVVDIDGADRRHFPEKINVEPQTVSLLETKVYLPTFSWIQKLSTLFAKIQAGSIHIYLLYLCLTLILLMAVGTRL